VPAVALSGGALGRRRARPAGAPSSPGSGRRVGVAHRAG
jgi:hypothetical protein